MSRNTTDGARVLVLTTVFPNPRHPLLGVFIRERVRHVASSCPTVVVAPYQWFPFDGLVRRGRWAGVPYLEDDGDVRVFHPRILSVPGVLKSLDGVLYAASLLPLLARLRRTFPFDIIDAHFVYPDGTAAVLLGKALGCPVTVTLRGTIVRLARHRLHRAQIRRTLRAATRVFSVSESLKQLAVSLGVSGDHIRVIPNGVDTGLFHPGDRAAARERLALPRDRTIVLSVAALSMRKGHQRVLEALPGVVRERPDVLYVVVGGPTAEGDTLPLLKALIAELGLGEHVRLVGARPHDEIPTWLQAADLFCLATSNEGRANVLIEALACGLPVVATSIAANVELVEHGRDGVLVPLDDREALVTALRRAVDTEWDRAAIARRAGSRSWSDSAAEVIAEFQDIVRPAPVGSRPAHRSPPTWVR